MEAMLEATMRDSFGKNEARRIRAGGRVPAVLYGVTKESAGREAKPISVDPKSLLRILHSESGANTLISLKLSGEHNTRVLVKAYQLDPVTHQLLHADFYRIRMDRAIIVTIPVTVKGEPKGVKQQGGVLEFIRREIEIECLPGEIPEHVEIDVSELMLHQGVRVREIATDAKWTPKSDPDMMLLHVVTIKVVEEATPAAGADGAVAVAAAPAAGGGAEPEVIKKGKTDKDGDAKADKKDDKKK